MTDLVDDRSGRGLTAELSRRTAPYRAVLASRVRAQRSYKASFRMDLLGSVLVGLVELAEVWVLFHNAGVIGGLGIAQVLLVFGLADLAFSFADLAFGHCDDLAKLLRLGTLDVFYLRPQPLLLQLVTSDVSLRRVARAAVAVGALVTGLVLNGVTPTPATVGLLVVALLSGVAISGAMFVVAAGIQFFVVDGAEMTNAFVYGGRYAATQPASVWSRPIKAAFVFVFPVAFTGYLPVVTLLGLPGVEWLPPWLGWCAPVAAVWAWVFAVLAWRAGVRHYQGGGG
jgi:ABC-2 type transport system permease protein